MRVLVLSHRGRYERFAPKDAPAFQAAELVFCDREASEEEWLAAAGDAEALFVTPVTWIRESLVARMPNLKLIHCEGVGFDRIDLEAARKRGIYVCNNAGCNAGPVAEQAVMLMSMLLHRTLWGHRMVLEGHQGEAVRMLEGDVPPDLSTVTVGLVGFGAIAKETAKRLRVHGSKVYYYSRHRKDAETEAAFGVAYLPLEELTARCDIVSLHLPATAESTHMVDRAFLAQMKPGAFLVNTARGAIIDDGALCEAIRSGHLAGAGLDAYSPEPVPADHPLLRLAHECPDKLILCPHQAGITQSSFRNVYRMLFENLGKLMAAERPDRVVNGL
ncbi:2-hydroxyacid dehydrogenase [Dysosmobacter sp.]|uniref:2-hydroxyacid dehydrogenase n=1 Tax=Dysosmobacter sp. TaxID=2591382 RepID=UPI002A95A17F|nr:2-hydroxyacid dehydrogenase [Dysosmobacter sp.]MDY5612924.1 2-hydroxyacid dehydrogenase [Dysosmobacter sp.]